MSTLKNLMGCALLASLIVTMAHGADAEPKKVKLKTKPYPLSVCAVSDEKLGSMGEPVVFVVDGQEIQLCCKGCRKDFDKNKEASLKKVEAAWKKVKPYPLTACIASDEPLDPEHAIGLVHEGREFVFCCKSCMKEFRKDPATYVRKFDEAAARKKAS